MVRIARDMRNVSEENIIIKHQTLLCLNVNHLKIPILGTCERFPYNKAKTY